MLIQIPEYKNELKRIIGMHLPYEELQEKKILIAGASGMIGSAIVDTLMFLAEEMSMEVYALGRNKLKLEKRFTSYLKKDYFHIWEHNIENPISYGEKMDYIIHAASDANPIAYATHPVEVMKANFFGMVNLLEYGRNVGVQRVLYISSGEMYGKTDSKANEFNEDYVGYVDYSDSRSCYPSIKRATEVLCQSYIKEYNMDIVIVRPCHIYGPTMTESDSRAVSAFLRNAVNGEDIVLKSDGSNRRSMCYVLDTVTAILTILLCGRNGQAYNISGEDEDISILELAEIISKLAGCKVVFSIPDAIEKAGFNRVEKATLNSNKIKEIGWKNQTTIYDGVKLTLQILKKELGRE